MSFLRGLGWTLVVYVIVLAVAFGLSNIGVRDFPDVYGLIVGIVVALVLAHRGGYRLDWIGWICGIVPVWGWLVLFWRRDHQISKARAAAGTTAS